MQDLDNYSQTVWKDEQIISKELVDEYQHVWDTLIGGQIIKEVILCIGGLLGIAKT